MAWSFLTNQKAAKENGYKSEVRELRKRFNELVSTLSYSVGLNFLTSAPSTKTGTTSNLTWRSEAFTAIVGGVNVSKAAAETAFTQTTHDIAAAKEAWFVLCMVAGGTITIVKAADQTIGTILLPAPTASSVVLGHLQIVTKAAGTGFVAATTPLVADGTNITSLAFYDAYPLYTVNNPDAQLTA